MTLAPLWVLVRQISGLALSIAIRMRLDAVPLALDLPISVSSSVVDSKVPTAASLCQTPPTAEAMRTSDLKRARPSQSRDFLLPRTNRKLLLRHHRLNLCLLRLRLPLLLPHLDQRRVPPRRPASQSPQHQLRRVSWHLWHQFRRFLPLNTAKRHRHVGLGPPYQPHLQSRRPQA